jgi:MoxR-like ATPase
MTETDFWRGRRVLLTGHTGFKGAWTALWLERAGAQVTGFALAPPSDRDGIYRCVSPWPQLHSIIGDLRDPGAVSRAVAEADPEIVIHMAAQALVRRLPVGEKVVQAILGLVRSGRPDDSASENVRNFVAWGPSPRASQAFMLAIRARALLEGRFAPSIDDVIALAHPILRHRMALNFSARAEGATIAQVIDGLCQAYL